MIIQQILKFKIINLNLIKGCLNLNHLLIKVYIDKINLKEMIMIIYKIMLKHKINMMVEVLVFYYKNLNKKLRK